MKNFFLFIALLTPFGALESQGVHSSWTSGLIEAIASTPRLDLVQGSAVNSPPAATYSHFAVRPIVVGALIGGAVGAAVGHEIGGPRSCPTSPNYPCAKSAFGTVGGAALGVVVGGAIGAVIGTRHRDALHGEISPIVNGRVGLSYSRLF